MADLVTFNQFHSDECGAVTWSMAPLATEVCEARRCRCRGLPCPFPRSLCRGDLGSAIGIGRRVVADEEGREEIVWECKGHGRLLSVRDVKTTSSSPVPGCDGLWLELPGSGDGTTYIVWRCHAARLRQSVVRKVRKSHPTRPMTSHPKNSQAGKRRLGSHRKFNTERDRTNRTSAQHLDDTRAHQLSLHST
jgi:hypothetical protein